MGARLLFWVIYVIFGVFVFVGIGPCVWDAAVHGAYVCGSDVPVHSCCCSCWGGISSDSISHA